MSVGLRRRTSSGLLRHALPCSYPSFLGYFERSSSFVTFAQGSVMDEPLPAVPIRLKINILFPYIHTFAAHLTFGSRTPYESTSLSLPGRPPLHNPHSFDSPYLRMAASISSTVIGTFAIRSLYPSRVIHTSFSMRIPICSSSI